MEQSLALSQIVDTADPQEENSRQIRMAVSRCAKQQLYVLLRGDYWDINA